ncbi:unnamed protein product [Dovyalis caffra]|uniref:Ubiquitin-like protease family profile domain-containing protein n=1 Tax=Dovyalis caffra TaxID=77055 RepID=A0AAV1RPS8_9ROSI|nr:unnamed protein product [Dovyalis caffra]
MDESEDDRVRHNKRLNVCDTSLINLLRFPPTYIPIKEENQYWVDDTRFLLSGKWCETKALSALEIEEIAGSLKLFVPVCLKDHWILICVDIEKQALLCRVDCGIFVMKYADCLAHGNHFPFTQEDIPHFRHQVFLDIYRGRLPIAVSILGFRKVDQQPQQQNSSVGACDEGEKFGLEEEVEKLNRDKNVLMRGLIKLRQSQCDTDIQLQATVKRLQGTEQRQQQMMSFLAKAMQSRDLPNFAS